LEDLDQRTAQKLNIEGGVRVNKLYPGKLRQQTQMKEGFIITKLNQQTIRSVDQLIELLQNYEGGVMLEGVYEDIPGTYYYAFGL
jgi:serine protease Do